MERFYRSLANANAEIGVEVWGGIEGEVTDAWGEVTDAGREVMDAGRGAWESGDGFGVRIEVKSLTSPSRIWEM
eukprot:1380382-Amorphochlora_amoeboformis.AAC.1